MRSVAVGATDGVDRDVMVSFCFVSCLRAKVQRLKGPPDVPGSWRAKNSRSESPHCSALVTGKAGMPPCRSKDDDQQKTPHLALRYAPLTLTYGSDIISYLFVGIIILMGS